MARIRVIEPDEATGELADIYADLTRSRGRLAEVHKIQSLNPQSIRDHMALYTTVMFSRSPLSRAEREMMAVVVSATNGCAYCIEHHGQALLHFWKDRGRVRRVPARSASRHQRHAHRAVDAVPAVARGVRVGEGERRDLHRRRI
ncbi:MAG: carboxymuconolactone decarboxylase family protein [Spirochaetota bacterium]